MSKASRRHFMQNVGSGMLIAGLGSQLAIELGVAAESTLMHSPTNDYGGSATGLG